MGGVKSRLDVESLGIVEGDDKRFLEDYINPLHFRQRKSYDEYYLDISSLFMKLDFNDLTILAERFEVSVLEDGTVVLKDR